MPSITTVIFDMYDTLVRNNGNLWDITFARIIQDQELPVATEKLLQEWRVADAGFRDNRIQPGRPFESYYHGWESAFRGAFAAMGLNGDAQAATDQVFADLSRRDPFPETIEAIRQLQSSYRTAVLSNADDGYLLPMVDRLDLKFEKVLSSEGVRVYKPEAGVFEEMIKELGIRPEEAAYVGDKQFEDVLGSSRVGMHSVWINRTSTPLDPQLPTPSFQIVSLLELPALLAGAGTG